MYNAHSFRTQKRDPALRSPYSEDALDLSRYSIDRGAPWGDESYLEQAYVEGKRQMETIVLQQATVPAATVRLSHVLAPDDWTQRWRTLIEGVRQRRRPIAVHRRPGASSFVHADDAARVLVGLLTSETTGPINVAAEEPVDVLQLLRTIGETLAEKPIVVEQDGSMGKAPMAPFSY